VGAASGGCRLRRLRSAGAIRDGEPLSIQLVPVPAARELARPEAELVLEGIDLLLAPVLVRTE